MVTDPLASPDAEDAALDWSARLASGVAHELGGLLFAMRMRLETLALSLREETGDLAALMEVRLEMQAVVGALRLLGARSGTGRIVREQAVDSEAWWHRTTRLARYVVPRGVEIRGSAVAGIALDHVDLRRFTEGALLLATHAATRTGLHSVSIELRRAPRGDRLIVVVRPEAAGMTNPATVFGSGPLLSRARRVVRPTGGVIRTRSNPTGRWFELWVPATSGAR